MSLGMWGEHWCREGARQSGQDPRPAGRAPLVAGGRPMRLRLPYQAAPATAPFTAEGSPGGRGAHHGSRPSLCGHCPREPSPCSKPAPSGPSFMRLARSAACLLIFLADPSIEPKFSFRRGLIHQFFPPTGPNLSNAKSQSSSPTRRSLFFFSESRGFLFYISGCDSF